MGERDLVLTWLKVFVVVLITLALPASASAAIGKVLSVKQGAEVVRAGQTLTLRKGMDVVSGDTITTNRSGVVQLLFTDQTKIAVGPNARMVLDVSMMRGNRKAKSFAVQALGGSFRFISGNSKKRAYSIKTPTATMSVRGTTFDIWVPSGDQSAMLVLEGTVQMCSLRGGCRYGDQQCSMLATGPGGKVGRPASVAQYDNAMKNGFPFLQQQQRLLPPFHVNIGGCSGAEALAPKIRTETRETSPRQEQNEAEPARAAGTRSASRSAPARSEPTGTRAEASAGSSSTRASASAGSVSVSVDLSGDGDDGSGTSATATAGGVSAHADTR